MKLSLKSKHQRLILQCYPPGKNVDKKPNPSELSYLLYYATTRRTKLLKIGTFLQKKVINDYNHSRSGNLLVSLDIIKNLIDKCSDNLDVFSSNLLVIFKYILLTKDLSLCQYCLIIFKNFCSKIRSDLFNGDKDLLAKFDDLARSFLNFGFHPIEPNVKEWIIIGLKSIRCFSYCIGYNTAVSQDLIDTCMPLLLSNIDHRDDILNSKLRPYISNTNGDELRRTNSFGVKKITTTRSAYSVVHDKTDDSETSVNDEALESLRSLFDSTSLSVEVQLNISSNSLITYILKYSDSINNGWTDSLIQLATSWTPIQLRFKFLENLLEKLKTSKDYKKKFILTNKINSLLTSSVTLIGLVIPDTLKSLVDGQLTLLEKSEIEKDDALVQSYTTCIGSLTSHIYYKNQISDMINDLLKIINDVAGGVSKRNNDLVLTVLGDILTVFNHCYDYDGNSLITKQRNHCDLESLEDCFKFLIDKDHEICSKFFKITKIFLKYELNDSNELYLQPNYNHYISNDFKNPLFKFFNTIHDYLLLQKIETEKILQLLELLDLSITKFGINAIANGLPFFFEWQLSEENPMEFTEKEILKDSIGYYFIYHSSLFLKLNNLTQVIINKIKYRKEKNLWSNEIIINDVSNPSESFESSTSQLILSRQDVKKYLVQYHQTNDEDKITNWIDIHKSLNDHQSQDYIVSIPRSNTLASSTGNRSHLNMVSLSLDQAQAQAQLQLQAQELDPNGTLTSSSTTTNSNLPNNHLEIRSIYSSSIMNRSFTPTSMFASSAHTHRHNNGAPRTTDLRQAISGSNLRSQISSNGGGKPNSSNDNGNNNGNGNGISNNFLDGSSMVSSKIVNDVGSFLAELDVDGDLSSDEDNVNNESFRRGRLVTV